MKALLDRISTHCHCDTLVQCGRGLARNRARWAAPELTAAPPPRQRDGGLRPVRVPTSSVRGMLDDMVSRDAARAYVQGWAETGRLLEEQRWAELAALSSSDALAASDMLIDAALQVPLPDHRRKWSGLVTQQDVFRRRPS